MGLALLSLKNYNRLFLKIVIRFTILVVAFNSPLSSQKLFAQNKKQQTSNTNSSKSGPNIKQTWKFENYVAMQQHLLGLIKNAKKRIWLTSRFLSDADFSLALYVARYRHLDIRVGLGEKLLHHPLSLYSELLDEKVPVQKLKISENSISQTSVIIDNRAYSSNSILHPLVKRQQFEVKEVILPSMVDQTSKKNAKINSRKLASSTWRTFDSLNPVPRKSKRSRTNESSPASFRAETYDYTGKKHSKPENIKGTLPRKLKWQKSVK